jgi:hypothetical protein
LATTFHWCGDLLDWIADSWRPEPCDADEDAAAAGEGVALELDGGDADDAIDAEALSKEQLIRAIVAGCVEEELAAETIRLNMLGLCRSLGALSQMAAEESTHKQTCMEAAGVIAVAASCERMLRSVSGFRFVRTYRFIKGSAGSD